MRCEICEKKEATIHLTQVINNKVKKIQMCEDCAAKSGLDIGSPMGLSDVLLGLGAQKETAETSEKRCPRCHMRYADFKKASRLGCQECYDVFAAELDPLLEAMHKGKQHVGKVPIHAEADGKPLTGSALKSALQAAIVAEKYEEAANIRDRIRQLQERDAGDVSPGKRNENR